MSAGAASQKEHRQKSEIHAWLLDDPAEFIALHEDREVGANVASYPVIGLVPEKGLDTTQSGIRPRDGLSELTGGVHLNDASGVLNLTHILRA